jgi:secreted trypsin-like serine protease
MLCNADIADSRDRWRRTSMTSVGKVTVTVWRAERKVFSAPSRESSRRSLAYETSMVPQDHCQRTWSMCAATVNMKKPRLIINCGPYSRYQSRYITLDSREVGVALATF